jgi:excisionase family DNA binding protein
MAYLFAAGTRQYDGSIHLPLYLVHRWQRQMEMPYAGLSEQEKQSDRNEVAHILPIIKEYIASIDKELTTQQAADILQMSRPYLIKLLEHNEIPFIKTGTHRRIRLNDLMEYKKRREAERAQGLTELTQLSQEYGLYEEEGKK